MALVAGRRRRRVKKNRGRDAVRVSAPSPRRPRMTHIHLSLSARAGDPGAEGAGTGERAAALRAPALAARSLRPGLIRLPPAGGALWHGRTAGRDAQAADTAPGARLPGYVSASESLARWGVVAWSGRRACTAGRHVGGHVGVRRGAYVRCRLIMGEWWSTYYY
jgi:hypothetical protein